MEFQHSHDPIAIRKELIALVEASNLKIEYLSAAASPLASMATSASVLTFLSLQLFLNGSNSFIRLFAGINIILLLIMVFLSLVTQIMIYRSKLRLARVNHDLKSSKILSKEEFSKVEQVNLVNLSHLASRAANTVNQVQWLYTHGLFRILYSFVVITVGILIFLIGLELVNLLQREQIMVGLY